MTVTAPRQSPVADVNARGDLPTSVLTLDNPLAGPDLPAAAGSNDRTTVLDSAEDGRRTNSYNCNSGLSVRSDSHFSARMVVPIVDFVLILTPLLWRPAQFSSMAMMAVLGAYLLSDGGRYVVPLHISALDELPSIVGRLLTAMAIASIAVLYLRPRPEVVPFLQTACEAALLVVFGRVLIMWILVISRRRGIMRRRAILIGGGPVAAELARTLLQHREYGLDLTGFLDDGDHCPVENYLPCLGHLADLDRVVSTTGADSLMLADSGIDERALIESVRTETCRDAELLVVPRLHHFYTATGRADRIGSIPIMRIRSPRLYGPAQAVKRGLDVVVATVALIVLLPVIIGAAVATRIEGGRGVIFRQVRVGRDGRHFQLLKFRSMRPANDAESETMWCVANDSRVGPVGRFLRCTSIDELPQLWNILRGDMAVVGPRPERPHFVAQFSMQFDRYNARHRVQVGLTGLAQVCGLRGDTSIADRTRYDNFYIENWSLWLDIKIILRTFRQVFCYRGR
ncbi:exopolysaccharide biosynthesis polyprenyl glycosylphosphotransferase [Mycobacterium sp. OAS707]|uniref:sugar transferase n=1 Tax=Mycobacterium sp. OAS707 TaxID=2663822 RepID=UPI001A00E429|nr:sugar transferase [Mycobacterium sp. OAS707]MBE1548002.1 exopolysaccharide biosynthesis polyprenyl glycosylphosphotransferase [Mycobacterium sp. OAS707]